MEVSNKKSTPGGVRHKRSYVRLMSDALGSMMLFYNERIIAARFQLGATFVVFVTDFTDITSSSTNPQLKAIYEWAQTNVEPFDYKMFRVPPNFFDFILFKTVLPPAIRAYADREIQIQQLDPTSYRWIVDDDTVAF